MTEYFVMHRSAQPRYLWAGNIEAETAWEAAGKAARMWWIERGIGELPEAEIWQVQVPGWGEGEEYWNYLVQARWHVYTTERVEVQFMVAHLSCTAVLGISD